MIYFCRIIYIERIISLYTMEKIKYYLEKYLKQIIICAIIIVVGLIILIIPKDKKSKKEDIISYMPEVEIKEEPKKEKIIETVKVDVKGAVVNPGVYELNVGSRVKDAINSAGGLSENANVEYINLSKTLKDEMVIIIYTNEYIEKYKNEEERIIYIKYECDCPSEKNDACIEEKNVANEVENSKEKDTNKRQEDNIDSLDDKVSINTASIDELMTLKGIGESKAKAIIEYREQNGEFKSLEDIMNVSGIGESAYSKIKDNIKL